MDTIEFDTIKSNILDPLKLLLGSSENMERLDTVESVARFLFSSENITVNATGILLAALAGLALGLKLIFGLTLFDVMDAMTGQGQGFGGGGGYGSSYGSSYGVSSGYGSGYSQPSYSAPSSGYSSRSSDRTVELTAEQKSLYPELGQLHDQLQEEQNGELGPRNHIHYKGGIRNIGLNSGELIGHSY